MPESGDDEPSSQLFNHRICPQNFCAFVPYACAQYSAPFCVKMNVQMQAEYIRVDDKKKSRLQRLREFQSRTSKEAVTAEEHESEGPKKSHTDARLIVITVVKDIANEVVEVIFDRCIEIPIILIKVIALCMPYQRHLHKLTVRRTPLLAVTIYQFSKFVSQLTEVCLDGSPLAGRNHELLLAPPSRLYYLSLASCELDDEDCTHLAEMLMPPRAAASSLHVLLLPSNSITDEGARALALTLRSNRGLQYLNLAGNRITDAGAISIFKSLMEFPLTDDESNAKSLRYLKFLKRRAEEFAKITKDLSKGDASSVADVRPTRRNKPIRGSKFVEFSPTDNTVLKANILTAKLVGPFIDPFNCSKTVLRDRSVCCVGNLALCGLNLSYNRLHYPSITWLWEVLKQQHKLEPERSEPGLLRVLLDGNNLPSDCEELHGIDELLGHAVARLSRQVQVSGKSGRGNKNRLTVGSRVAMPHKPSAHTVPPTA